MTVGFEPSLRSQLAGADLKLQLHRAGIIIARQPPLRVSVLGPRAGQSKSLVPPTPRFDVRQEMQLGLLGHPGWSAERCDEFAGTRQELGRISDPLSAVVAVPTRCHGVKLNPGRCHHPRVLWCR